MGEGLAAGGGLGKIGLMQFEGFDGRIGGPRWWARALSFGAGMGLLLGVLGPFGSYLNPMPLRILDQMVMNISGVGIAGLLIPPLLGLASRSGLPRLFSIVVAVAITAVPIAAWSAVVSLILWPQNVAHYHLSNWYFEALLLLACLVALWVVIEAARTAWGSLGEGAIAMRVVAPASSAPGSAICLQTEDNYVRVHRDQGSTLELMPLHAAIARFGGADGLQVHRGWWVASAAVVGAERDARNWRLRLNNGLRVPVARNRVIAARARGWIEAQADDA